MTEETENTENTQLKRILEGAILAVGEPLSIQRLQGLFGEDDMPEKDEIKKALEDIRDECEGRGFGLIEVASGWRFQVVEDVAPWINRLWDEKPQKYSRALLETLSLIAYRQPLTRGDIEEVRGVAVSSHIIKTLTEREWVKVIGHRDVPGRPALYATTRGFLDYFNLKSLDELPTLGDLKDIESLNQALAFDGEAGKTEDGAEKAEASEGGSTESIVSTEADNESNEEGVQQEEVKQEEVKQEDTEQEDAQEDDGVLPELGVEPDDELESEEDVQNFVEGDAQADDVFGESPFEDVTSDTPSNDDQEKDVSEASSDDGESADVEAIDDSDEITDKESTD